MTQERVLGATREVSAVTGACLAVERGKFDAVGGFALVCYGFLPIEWAIWVTQPLHKIIGHLAFPNSFLSFALSSGLME